MPTFVFPGRYESLAKIAELVQVASREFGLDSCAAYGVETAVDEACSNIIEHAYGGEDKGEIEFSYQVNPSNLVITLRDNGKKFKPRKVHTPQMNIPLKNKQNHGLGLYFIHQWMDEVYFDHMDGYNILTMIKYKGQMAG